MTNQIDKTTYLEYLECPKNAWLKLHRPEIAKLYKCEESVQYRMEQGNLIEIYARNRFMNGVLILKYGLEACFETQNYIMNKTSVLFQATFIADIFLARCDVLEYDVSTGKWNLYEIKSSSSGDEKDSKKNIKYQQDLSFQAVILKDQGIELNKISVISINPKYILGEFIEVNSLFISDDMTLEVKSLEADTRSKMLQAKLELLHNDEKKLLCSCHYKSSGNQCETFIYSHSYVPAYSIYDISRIHKRKLESLVNDGIWDINDIPDDFELSQKQKKQINVYKQQIIFINNEAIKNELSSLQFPLYFLDYETYAPAIPLFKSTSPYIPIPFQFSLHVLKKQDDIPEHFEYLHEIDNDPCLIFIQKLQECIGLNGTLISWYKSFEITRNKYLALRYPQYKEFLDDLNNRTYNLEDIFTQQFYIHNGFKGKTSIKKVLPVLVPELNYDSLNIRDGISASQRWYEMVYEKNTIQEKQKIADDLRKYCGLDTYAMYAIWKHLSAL